ILRVGNMALIPKPVRRVLFWLIIAFLGYHAYTFVRVHASQEVIVFKQYSSALMDRDYTTVSHITQGKASAPFQDTQKRDEAIKGEITFVYYKIRNVRRSPDGRMSTIDAQQIIRYNPVGTDSFWGIEKIVNNQSAVLT